MPELSGLLRHTAGLGTTQPKVGKHAQAKPTSSSMLEHRITLFNLLLASGPEEAAKNKTHTALLQQRPGGPAHTMTGPRRRGTACPWHSTKGLKQDGIYQAFHRWPWLAARRNLPIATIASPSEMPSCVSRRSRGRQYRFVGSNMDGPVRAGDILKVYARFGESFEAIRFQGRERGEGPVTGGGAEWSDFTTDGPYVAFRHTRRSFAFVMRA